MYGYNIGQTADQVAQWDQALNEAASAEFHNETGWERPNDFDMQIVWLTFKYAAIRRGLFMTEQTVPPDPTTGAPAPAPPWPVDQVHVRWLTEYKRILDKFFADNPTFEPRAQQAMQRIMSQRSAAAVRSGYYY